MFEHEELKNHLETSSSVSVSSKVIAEWNMNIPTNIYQIGNYRYRPSEGPSTKYGLPAGSFDPQDAGNYYTDATYSDILIDGGTDNLDQPSFFLKRKEKEQQLYSLEDCFARNRPRSGINKLRWFPNTYSHFVNSQMAQRPRYYPSSRQDSFKYWTSFRIDENTERGIANTKAGDSYYIDDACPYVVYDEPVPANRIVVKMQTNVGDVNIRYGNGSADPFFGQQNSTTPVRWRIQYLNNDTWTDAVKFDENSSRPDGSPVIGTDGYVELAYGPLIPENYQASFKLLGTYTNDSLLPTASTVPHGHAYLIKPSESSAAKFYISNGIRWTPIVAYYGWYLNGHADTQMSPYATELVDLPTSYNPMNGETTFTEFQYIKGIRIVVETMNKYESMFDLIELSPRLAVDLSDKTTDFKIVKSASDLGVSGLPVSQLLASTGSLELFDYDQAFLSSNSKSIISNLMQQRVQFKFYEVIKDFGEADVSVPIKTLYSESFPETRSANRSVAIEMRDLFYYLEEQTAPQLLAQGVSMSYAISLLLDSIGFSNYTTYGLDDDSDLEIPFFFVGPDMSVAQVLNDLAISSQSAMFFDEYNNLVVMSKNYMLPSEEDRPTDVVLHGTKDFQSVGEQSNLRTSSSLANIQEIASQDKQIYNGGVISYTSRYIQRSYGSIKQASLLDRDKTWTYKPVLLWEVAPTEQTKPINSEVAAQSSYVLGAVPLNSDLSADVPRVKSRKLINNFMDFGDGIYWITRYNGYFYANGEIIKYDAVQFSIPGLTDNAESDNVWISSAEEYSRYFAQLPFNGKMYPTGLVRIFAEPEYEVVDGTTFFKDGPVAKHGRGQFDTKIVPHQAGLSDYWRSEDNVRGCKMDFLYLSDQEVELPNLEVGPAGQNHERAKDTTRTGLIKNFLASKTISENKIGSDYPATVQSSAFVFNGSSFATTDNPLDHVSYVYKPLEERFTHCGTRMRIIGKVEDNPIRGQSPVGSFTYFTPSETRSDQPSAIAGASGGVAVSINPETNVGYYFELVSLTDANLEEYQDTSVSNMLFYKVMKNADGDDDSSAIPVPLWTGIGDILVDDGRFVGQSRLSSTETTTVYDMAVEFMDIGGTRRFFLYVNNVMVAIVDDADPLPEYNNMALFVRGSSECMFENIYALANNYSQNSVFELTTESSPPIADAFGSGDVSANQSFQKYAMSGLVQDSYLSGLGPSEPPKYNIYYEEFGTIMREAAYFNVRYDKAFPALYAKLSPTFNKVKGYSVSNFFAGAYGAEFMIFNATDTALNLDSTSGNYLRIQGVTFTQASTNELTVDDYFNNKTDASLISLKADNSLSSPVKAKKDYFNIRQSRLENGSKEFSLSPKYIQSEDAAEELMGWMVDKIMKPSKSVGVDVFAMPIIQLGDIVKINYTNADGVNEVADSDSRFVVYNIEYSRSGDGPNMKLFLSEVK